MRRRILISFLLIFSIQIFAFEFPIPNIFSQIDLSYAANKGIEHNEFLFSTEVGAEWSRVDLISGIQFYSDVFDFTLAADWYPEKVNFDLETSNVALGFSGIYHFQNQFDIASENDFNTLSSVTISTDGGFSFRAVLGYGFKLTNVYALPAEFGLLWDNNILTGFFISQEFRGGWEVYCSCKNYDMYRYYLSDNPLHTFGGSYTYERFKFNGEIELKFTDQFKSTPYMSGLWFRLSTRYYFK